MFMIPRSNISHKVLAREIIILNVAILLSVAWYFAAPHLSFAYSYNYHHEIGKAYRTAIALNKSNQANFSHNRYRKEKLLWEYVGRLKEKRDNRKETAQALWWIIPALLFPIRYWVYATAWAVRQVKFKSSHIPSHPH